MHDAAVAVAALARQVQGAIWVAGEVSPQLHQVQDTGRALTAHNIHRPEFEDRARQGGGMLCQLGAAHLTTCCCVPAAKDVCLQQAATCQRRHQAPPTCHHAAITCSLYRQACEHAYMQEHCCSCCCKGGGLTWGHSARRQPPWCRAHGSPRCLLRPAQRKHHPGRTGCSPQQPGPW